MSFQSIKRKNELVLKLEHSFPKFVFGDFNLFQLVSNCIQIILYFLKLLVNIINHVVANVKESKIELNCKMKVIAIVYKSKNVMF